MLLSTLELLGGIALAIVTLRDVFETVIVPGGSQSTLRIARRSVFVLLPLWKLLRRGRGISTSFAPAMLVTSFAIWMVLLAVAFGLMVHALAGWFHPPLPSLTQAIYLAGSSLITIGMSETDATGPARWVVLVSGACGMAVMTMAVTYLLEVQSSLARRDTGILKLRTSAGEPPCALGLLEKYAAIGNQVELAVVLEDGRDWCAAVLQSHVGHPSLIYFRSVGTGAGWPAALGALLDLALLIEHGLDLPQLRGRAVLLREDGTRMAHELIGLINLEAPNNAHEALDIASLKARLEACGYALRDSAEWTTFETRRNELAGCVAVLADHLGKPTAPLFPDEAEA